MRNSGGALHAVVHQVHIAGIRAGAEVQAEVAHLLTFVNNDAQEQSWSLYHFGGASQASGALQVSFGSGPGDTKVVRLVCLHTSVCV